MRARRCRRSDEGSSVRPRKKPKRIHRLGSFLVELRQQEGMGARALEFTILTACRSGEVRGATWAEIDTEAKTWTIPAERMKAGKEHRVPLSDSALALLNTLPRMAGTDVVFPGTKGQPLSDMTLTAVLRRMEVPATTHGFRSTFRDWAGERTAHPREVIEHALAHQLKDKAEAAYQRGSLFDKRRHLMDDWAAFLERPALPAQVIDSAAKRVHG
ncbi:MAG: site-specific integrase [Burkholderiales bacterium]|jgi:integrase|nr:site-specific integrase [Burkholderiales bacterium]